MMDSRYAPRANSNWESMMSNPTGKVEEFATGAKERCLDIVAAMVGDTHVVRLALGCVETSASA